MPWLDETLTLVVGQGATGGVHRRGSDIVVTLSRRSTRSSVEQARPLVEDWYRTEALKLLTAKSSGLAERLGLRCREVTVPCTRSRGGEGSSGGAVTVNSPR